MTTMPRTTLERPPTYHGRWPAVVEALVRNNGPDLELADGTVIDAGDVAVVDTADRVAAVELMFGRLERDPVLTGIAPWPTRPTGAVHLNDDDTDVTEGVHLP